MQPRIKLTFWATSSHCWFISNISSTDIPKSFSTGLLSVHSLLSAYGYWWLPRPRCSTLHLALFSFTRLTLAHLSSLSRSLWMASLSIRALTALLILLLIRNKDSEHSSVWIRDSYTREKSNFFPSFSQIINRKQQLFVNKQDCTSIFRITKCQSKVDWLYHSVKLSALLKHKNYSDNISVHRNQASRPFNLILTHLGPVCSNFSLESPVVTKKHRCYAVKNQFQW